MKSKAKVVVVGGGVVGVSALYHLKKRINLRLYLACSWITPFIQYELFSWSTS